MLTKVSYTDDEDIIYADNMNDIQDEIIDQCVTVEEKSFTEAQRKIARANIGLDYTVVATFDS